MRTCHPQSNGRGSRTVTLTQMPMPPSSIWAPHYINTNRNYPKYFYRLPHRDHRHRHRQTSGFDGQQILHRSTTMNIAKEAKEERRRNVVRSGVLQGPDLNCPGRRRSSYHGSSMPQFPTFSKKGLPSFFPVMCSGNGRN
jgi:hypothetical protein